MAMVSWNRAWASSSAGYWPRTTRPNWNCWLMALLPPVYSTVAGETGGTHEAVCSRSVCRHGDAGLGGGAGADRGHAGADRGGTQGSQGGAVHLDRAAGGGEDRPRLR